MVEGWRGLVYRRSQPIVIFRLLTPVAGAHEKAAARERRYDRIVQAQPRMRQNAHGCAP